MLLIFSIPKRSESNAGSVENPPPYPKFTIINNSIAIIPNIIDFAPFEIANVANATIVIIIQLKKIILYTVILSYNLSEIVEYPILPNALNAAVTDGITLIIAPKIAVPANATFKICFS